VTRLYKVSGAGNDFLVLLEPERDPTAAEVAAWCARGFAFGADGVFALRRAPDGALRMDHWNADGGRVEQCLNGTRCAARLAFELGWAEREVAIETGAGRVVGRRCERPASATIEVAPPQEGPRPMTLRIDGVEHAGSFARVGVPHFVIVTERGLAGAPVAELAPRIRRHPDFGPGGANVDWARFPAPHRMEIRSFERGVEGETLACGTGVLAAVAAGVALGRATLPVAVLVLGGFELEVGGEVEGRRIARFTLTGDARIVGAIELAADGELGLPSPPTWSP
jgi:diaminopimelate epimerase